MTRERLVPCPSCGAHVRANELRACPFCDERAADPASADASGTSSFGVRGGFVAASLLALSACAGEPETPPHESDSGGEVVVEDPWTSEAERPDPETDGEVVVEDPWTPGDGDSPPSDDTRDDVPVEPPPAAAYGGPPESVVQPLYGIPPD